MRGGERVVGELWRLVRSRGGAGGEKYLGLQRRAFEEEKSFEAEGEAGEEEEAGRSDDDEEVRWRWGVRLEVRA